MSCEKNEKIQERDLALMRSTYQRIQERNIDLIMYACILYICVVSVYSNYLNLPKFFLVSFPAISLCILAIIRYFFSSFRAEFIRAKSFSKSHEWKKLTLESGQYLAFPFGGVMPVPVPVATNEALDYLDTKSDLADIVLMPIGCVLGAIIGYREEINWWQTLIATTLFLYMAINFRQLEELVFKIFIKLNRV